MAPPFRLSLEGRSFPAHSGRASSYSQTVDWLPHYHGYSWLAYGSFSSLVISLAPVPTRKDEETNLEICHIMDSLHDTPITHVLWDPSCSGILASSTGNFICIYGPEFSDIVAKSEFPVFPRAWSLKHTLEHAYQVYSFAWTESGDGLLAVGTEVGMWMRNKEGWYKLWKSCPTHPQCFAAATFSAKGLAATADGDFMNLSDTQEHALKTTSKGKVTVWWWEDSVGLLEAELIHPQEVMMIQWRPSKAYALQKPFRPVLLTTCKDGAVRLWIEIDNGRGRLEKSLGKDVPLKHLKPSYFVGAVIEADQCLHGSLGKDVLVSWSFECRALWNLTSVRENNSVRNTISKRENTVSCEWLVGLGPDGSICVWGVLYIDDINPSRCPRVFSWKKSSGVLPACQPSGGIMARQNLMKVVAQSSERKWEGLPSFLDLFYTTHPLSFHWFRIWLPMNSINGNDSKDSLVSEITTIPDSGKKDAWGVVAEQLHADSHSHDVISLAVHPITHIGLIATLDNQGHVFLWKFPSFAYLVNIDSATCFSRWRPSGHFIGPLDSKMITWLPALFHKDRAILLLVHAGVIDCYIISENSLTSGFCLLPNLLYRIDVFAECPQQDLCDIWAIPMQNLHRLASSTVNFTIIGKGQTAHEVICCDLEISVKGADHHISDADRRDQRSTQGDLVAHMLGITSLKQPEHVSCIAPVPSFFLPFIETSMNRLMFESLPFARPYDFATGSIDGTVRLWKRGDQELSTRKYEMEDNYWACIGVLKARPGPVTMMSIGSFGLNIATAGPVIFDGHEVEIWNLESCMDIAYFNLNFKISVESCPISIQWLQAGNGQSMLGVLTETELHVYSEAKIKVVHTNTGKLGQTPWFHLASVRLFSSSSCFSWGPKGSLLLPSRDHILIYGPKLILDENKIDSSLAEPLMGQYNSQLMALWHEGWSLLKAGEVMNISLPLYHPTSLLYLLYTGNHQQARVCLSYLLQNLPNLSTNVAKEDPSDSCKMFSPMHLKEFFQTEIEKTGKFSTKVYESKLNWGSDLDHELEYHRADFNRMSLAHEVGGASTHMNASLSMEKLESSLHNLYICGLNEDEKNDLLTVADVLHKMKTVSKAFEYQSLDPPGKRFWVSVQLSHSKQCRIYGRNAHIEELTLDSKTMAWALQSDCKDSLLDICLGDELSWPAMRALGIGFWFTDVGQLRARMEKLARVQYLSEKDPKNCALLYLALQRKNVLLSLFKLSRDEKDKVLYVFLTRDFQEEKNQAAALKNAYVLMGKHRHDLAAAFFLLGGDLSSAVSVCAKNLGDLQLAFVICRLIEGINGETERKLIQDYALPNAHNTGDYWLACLFKWLVGERFQALEELAGKLKVSEVSGFLDIQGNEKTFSMVSQERTGLAISDPDVGHFCLLLATKATVESGLNSSSAMALRRWIMLKTSIALEKLGLQLHALEHLNLIPLSKETTVDYNASLNLKQLPLHNIQDKFPIELQALNCNIIFMGADIFTKVKMNLALQYQAQLVQAHPGWKFNDFIEDPSISDSVRDNIWVHHESSPQDLVMQANEKLVQSLHIFEKRYSIDPDCITAELAKFVYDQNSLYLQCLFVKGIQDEADSGKQLIMSKSSFVIVNDLLQKKSKGLLKVIVHVCLVCTQNMVEGSSLLIKSKARWESSVDMVELMHLTSDIGLLFLDNKGKIEAEPEMIVLLLILSSICSWQQCNWSALDLLIKLIKSGTTSLSVMNSEIDALLKTNFRKYSSNFTTDSQTSTFPDGTCLADLEKRHILALAFWDAFLAWAKKQSRYSVCKSSPEITGPDRTLSGVETLFVECVRVMASISYFFQRKLVLHINSNCVSSDYLNRWLWGPHTPTESISTQDSSEFNISMMNHEDIQKDQAFDSANNSVDKIWKKLVVHNHIKSALELGGAQQTSGFSSKGPPRSNAEGNMSGSITSRKERVLESSRDDKAADVGVNGDSNMLRHSASNFKFRNGEEVLHSTGDLLEAFCVNSCCPEQIVVASSKKGLIFLDLNTKKRFSTTENGLWGQVEWPQSGWAKSESTPLPTFVSLGIGLASKEGRSLGLGGSAVGPGVLTAVGKESSFKGAGVGIPGYGGVGALGLGWDDWEDFDGVIDPLATVQNVNTQAMDSHPLRPLFLVGSRNTHVYLWEFGKSSATATYGILPAANISPPYAVASVSAVRFDHSGHRFASSAIDGTVCTWQLEVGGRSNVRPTESYQCFTRHASDVALLGASGAIVAATGASENDLNLVFWDTLAPSTTSRASVFCHEGGARCLEMFDHYVGGGSFSPLIVTCGKAGDIALHDFRYIATGKAKRHKNSKHESIPHGEQPSKKQYDGDLNLDGMVWYLAKAHSGSITCVSAVPGTPLFLTGSKDGDVKLWDANKCELINHWPKVHEKHMFLQHNARGFGAVVQAAVTDVHPVPSGFVTSGGDGILRLFRDDII